MLKLENTEVLGWEHAIRGMRNPMNSWEKSDTDWVDIEEVDDRGSEYLELDYEYGVAKVIGPNDHKLMMSLAKGGPVHAKYRRMITVYVDITAPLYWWKEFDTYKVGTVANSCSTMHKIHERPFELSDFSIDQLRCDIPDCFYDTLDYLNDARDKFLETKDKKYWWQMIQLLPSSYNQKRTVMLNYEVLHNIYHSRKNHKLDEWHVVCDWIEQLAYSEIITCDTVTQKTEGVLRKSGPYPWGSGPNGIVRTQEEIDADRKRMEE
jgi:hypothetical protein